MHVTKLYPLKFRIHLYFISFIKQKAHFPHLQSLISVFLYCILNKSTMQN